MNKFIDSYISERLSNDFDFSKYVHVLPSRRAVNYFKKQLSLQTTSTILVPELFSIEDFITDIAQLEIIDSLSLAFQFYEIYEKIVPENERESFEVVYNWSQVLLQDFNEIDRYLIDTDVFFGNLSAIKEIEHWSTTQQPTEMLQKYLHFWKLLPSYYQAFSSHLLNQGLAYQGLAYRYASTKFPDFLKTLEKKFVFLGFNALNQAEQNIFQEVLDQDRGEVIWDIDAHFLASPNFGVGKFIQSYAQKWNYYTKEEKSILPSTTRFCEAKKINYIASTKQVGQAKAVANVLQQMNPQQIKETAVVLGDESLLPIILNHLPKEVEKVNITMGLPLSQTPFASFFEQVIQLQFNAKETWFVKDILDLLSHVVVNYLFPVEAKSLKEQLTKDKVFFLTTDEVLQKITAESTFKIFLRKLLSAENQNSEVILLHFSWAMEQVKAHSKQVALFNEYAFHFQEFFKRLLAQLQRQNKAEELSLGIFLQIYRDSISLENLDFEGMPFEGLQIMGMLETRLLDYKYIVMTSVNEGVLPSGKSVNSYIPFDLKIAYGLPTYREKDSVYAYHFFRLLQRAEEAYFIYNNDASGLDKAEASRFLLQLKTYLPEKHEFREHTWTSPTPILAQEALVIEKTPEIIAQIKQLFSSGISPSALLTYIRNPIDFYKQYVHGVREADAFEEEISYRSYGNAVHLTLENLYKKYLGKEVDIAAIQQMKKEYPELLQQAFVEEFSAQGLGYGSNLISTKVASQQILRFLNSEEEFLMRHSLAIVSLEANQRIEFKHPEIDFPVTIRGTADRIDKVDDQILRIIDYKTGKVEQRELNLSTDFTSLTEDIKYGKAFQVLVYALFFEDEINKGKLLQSGILSFKNLKDYYLWLTIEKNNSISKEILASFKDELASLLNEIADINHPFEEKTT